MKVLFILIPVLLFGQNLKSLTEAVVPSNLENIHVEKLSSDKNATNFLIFVKTHVKSHKHIYHTETLFVLEGTAEMMIGIELKQIKSGDFIVIPENTFHSVKVTSKVQLKVLSVQSPEFLGKDRVFELKNESK